MLQMLLPRRHCNFMMLTRTIHRLPILAAPRTSNHRHRAADLHDFAAQADCRAYCGIRGREKAPGEG